MTANERLAEAREALGFSSKADFAKRVGIERSAYDKMEKGPNKPSADSLQKIIEVFPALNLNWLLLGQGDMLRDGRALTPAPPSDPDPTRPAGGLTLTHSILGNPDALRLYELLEDERAAHQRTREEHARDRERNHEVQVELIKHLGGKAEASADAAEDAYYEPAYMVAETNHAYQEQPNVAAVAATWFGYADSLR